MAAAMSDIFMTYPGGKNGSGTFQKIINLMPPHRTYIEPFLGGGAILRAKRPARCSIGIDIDAAVIKKWELNPPADISNLMLLQGDAIVCLKNRRLFPELQEKDCLIYCDPPYLMSTRSSQRQIYEFELAEENEHRTLLEILKQLNCMIMISGYWSSLYAELLATWRSHHFEAVTRGGTMATEWVWMNFPEPVELHDYRYLGKTFRERERIKRKKTRWIQRLSKMAVLERQAILMALAEIGIHNAQPGIIDDRKDDEPWRINKNIKKINEIRA